MALQSIIVLYTCRFFYCWNCYCRYHFQLRRSWKCNGNTFKCNVNKIIWYTCLWAVRMLSIDSLLWDIPAVKSSPTASIQGCKSRLHPFMTTPGFATSMSSHQTSWANVGLMLAHPLQRWTTVKSTLIQHLVNYEFYWLLSHDPLMIFFSFSNAY